MKRTTPAFKVCKDGMLEGIMNTKAPEFKDFTKMKYPNPICQLKLAALFP